MDGGARARVHRELISEPGKVRHYEFYRRTKRTGLNVTATCIQPGVDLTLTAEALDSPRAARLVYERSATGELHAVPISSLH